MRVEVKLLMPAAEHQRIAAWLRTHSQGFREAFPPRLVHNLYLDTFEARAFNENLAGVSSRSKVRYRWYGEEALPTSGVLEVKRRRNRLGWKHQFAVAELETSATDRWRKIIQTIRSQLSAEGRFWLDAHPMPILINQYRRTYLVSHDDRVRATIDTEQRVFDQRSSPFPRLGGSQRALSPAILEIKAAREDMALVQEALKEIPIRVGRSSKYVSGLSCIAGQ